MNRIKNWVIILITFLVVSVKAEIVYNVLDFGAKSNGSEKCTEAIRMAVKKASDNGGGTVYFPAGQYLTGPVYLKSNITMYIDAGAYIKFSNDFNDYLPMVPSRWEGTDVTNFSPLFYAYEEENITITGRGTIDGQGRKWWDTFFKLQKMVNDTVTPWQKEFAEQNKDILLPDDTNMIKLGFLRPPFIQPMYCKNILIQGITIVNSPFWTVNPEYCDNITITGITINNPESPNTDGINPESCSNVHISDCHISVGDDCITIKSGKDAPGRKMARPAENYTITNCTMLSGHGGVVIGSEMSGSVKKIVISNCVFDGTDRGIRIKSTRGRGGVVEDVQVSNIVAKNIKREFFMFNLMYSKTQPEPVSERTPQFRNIHISNVTGNARQLCAIMGLDEMPVNDLSFNDIDVDAKLGFTIINATNIRLNNIQLSVETGPAVNVENSEMIEINGIKNISPVKNIPVIEMKNVKESFIYNCYQSVQTDIFLSVDGPETENIFLGNNRQHLTKNLVVKGGALKKGAVVVK